MKRFLVVRAKETKRVLRANSEAELIEKYGHTNNSGWHITYIEELEPTP